MMSICISSDFGTTGLVSHIGHMIGSTGYLDWRSALLPALTRGRLIAYHSAGQQRPLMRFGRVHLLAWSESNSRVRIVCLSSVRNEVQFDRKGFAMIGPNGPLSKGVRNVRSNGWGRRRCLSARSSGIVINLLFF